MKVKPDLPSSVPCPIAFVGEAPGADEALKGCPFVGAAGDCFNGMLLSANKGLAKDGHAPIKREDCLVTNVFDTRPPENKVQHFFVKKKASKDVAHCPELGSYGDKGYLRHEHLEQFDRLTAEIKAAKPRIIVALGATALWALTGRSAITAYRGFVLPSKVGPKLISTFHPSNILRDWSHRPVAVADLVKAAKESEDGKLIYPKRHIWVAEKPSDVDLFVRIHIDKAKRFAYDVETEAGQITHISLAPTPLVCLVIPIWWNTTNYFSTEDEILIWQKLLRLFARKELEKVAQNGTYDLTYLLEYGIKALGECEDTMLLHHSIQPEMSKGLGFMGSYLTNERPWKTLRVKSMEGEKADA